MIGSALDYSARRGNAFKSENMNMMNNQRTSKKLLFSTVKLRNTLQDQILPPLREYYYIYSSL
jgi:hypothetical protein